MKTINRYILMVATSISLVACSQDDGLNNSYFDNTDAVHILAQVGSDEVTGGFTSRSNPLGTDEEQTKFVVDDELSVIADNQEAVIYSFDGTSWNPKHEGKHLLWNSDEMTFKAFYPANSNGSSFTDFTLPTAYNSLKDIAKGDYMTYSGSRKRNTSDNSVSLEMQRKMVRIVVNISKWGNSMPEGLVVNEITIHPNTKGYHDGELIAANSEETSVKAYKHTDEKFYALITPTTEEELYNEKLFMTVKVSKADGSDEQKFRVNRLPPNGIVAGNSYEYSLQIGKNAIVIKSISISDWTKGEAIPGGEADSYSNIITKTIEEALAEGKSDIELTLPSNPGEEDINAILDAFSEGGATEGSINLTVKGVTSISGSQFSSKQYLKSVSFPDLVSIGDNAFSHCYALNSFQAPKVESVGETAFENCSQLGKIQLGAISHINDTFLSGLASENIDLELSSQQKVLEEDASNKFVWKVKENGGNYSESEEFKSAKFLGSTFKSITCGSETYPK